MKKTSLLLIMFTLCRAAAAADPATPVVSVEPQLAGQATSSVAPGSPPVAGRDDFGFAHAPAGLSGPAEPAVRDDEYRSAAQPNPVLEGF